MVKVAAGGVAQNAEGIGAPWSEFTVTDRNLITGQNPGSAAAVARQLVAALSR